jgi:hypothetical protein
LGELEFSSGISLEDARKAASSAISVELTEPENLPFKNVEVVQVSDDSHSVVFYEDAFTKYYREG